MLVELVERRVDPVEVNGEIADSEISSVGLLVEVEKGRALSLATDLGRVQSSWPLRSSLCPQKLLLYVVGGRVVRITLLSRNFVGVGVILAESAAALASSIGIKLASTISRP